MATKEARDYIAQYIPLDGARLSDSDAELLIDFIDNINSYDTVVKEQTESGWYSGGNYTRKTRDEYIVNSDYTITHISSYRDDDGQNGEYSIEITSARDIINTLKDVF